ncbi:uncharacterized protein LY79DRAFT_297751 [Colletotrichum navitas]|uniref:Uncharacterized protein n=1 Tax=Colletotrichum navitas TaxID=681940 RepID=A0AAD8PTP5_9PEZI|nr:uncharacterized protein LY79DRAFT_297751 [Colletotrichum navitas]KAK1580593.1 hypothetical protein LY79DRAFT_297751 [Colletotrichum navitas]
MSQYFSDFQYPSATSFVSGSPLRMATSTSEPTSTGNPATARPQLDVVIRTSLGCSLSQSSRALNPENPQARGTPILNPFRTDDWPPSSIPDGQYGIDNQKRRKGSHRARLRSTIRKARPINIHLTCDKWVTHINPRKTNKPLLCSHWFANAVRRYR